SSPPRRLDCLREAFWPRILDARNPILGKIRNGGFGNWGGIADRVDELGGDEVLVPEVLLHPARETLHVNTSVGVLTPFVDRLNRLVVGLAVVIGGSGGRTRRIGSRRIRSRSVLHC